MASQESLLFSLDCKEEFQQMVDDTKLLIDCGFLDINTSFAALIISHLVTLGKVGVEQELKQLELDEDNKKIIIVHYIPNKDIQLCLVEHIDYFGCDDMVCADNVEINQLKFSILKEGGLLYDVSYRIHLHHAQHITGKNKECQCYQLYEKYLKDKEEKEMEEIKQKELELEELKMKKLHEKNTIELAPTKKVTKKNKKTEI